MLGKKVKKTQHRIGECTKQGTILAKCLQVINELNGLKGSQTTIFITLLTITVLIKYYVRSITLTCVDKVSSWLVANH